MSKLSDIERLLDNYETNHKEQRDENSIPAVAVLSFQDARALLAMAKAVERYFEGVDTMLENPDMPIDWDIADKNVEDMRIAFEALYHD